MLCGLDFEEALDFEIQRARAERHPLGLITAQVATRNLCSASERFEDERRLIQTINSRMRTQDLVGRTSDGRVVLAIPGATPSVVHRIATELSCDVAALSWSREAHVEVRAASLSASIPDGHRLLAAASSPSASLETSETVEAPSREVLAQPVGLALCGGAAWAAAHIGVLRGLEERGGSVAGIGATSAGALVAAMYGLGMDAPTMLERFESFAASDVMAALRRRYARVRITGRAGRSGSSRGRVGFAGPRELAVADDDLLRASVEHFIATDRPIESLRLPLALCATDLHEGSMTYFSHGSLHDALMAACAVPGLFRPQRVGAQLLVDGSLAGELPVAATRSVVGGAPIVGSHVRSPRSRPTSYDNGLAVATRLALIRQRELVCEQGRECARVVEVVVEDLGWMGFAGAARAERAGRTAALEQLATPGGHRRRPHSPTSIREVDTRGPPSADPTHNG